MFHGWMFDPDGDQAAADSTRSSTTLDTGSSVNPRTARRLVTASYTSIFTVIVLIQIFSSNSSEPEMFCGSDLFSSYERWSAFVLHQKHDEFRRLGLACVPSCPLTSECVCLLHYGMQTPCQNMPNRGQ